MFKASGIKQHLLNVYILIYITSRCRHLICDVSQISTAVPSAIKGGGEHLSGSPEQEGGSGGEDSTGAKAGVVAGR